MHRESKPSNHIYRVDKFIVPDSAREEFLSRANAIRDVLRKQEGFETRKNSYKRCAMRYATDIGLTQSVSILNIE